MPFTLRYVAFWHAKGMLSDADLPPFADREMAGAAWVDTAGASGSEAMFFICINYVDYVLSRLQIFL